jgi:hypothetical protein
LDNVVVITTFAADHINLYGQRFLKTFKKHCDYPLYIFAEDFDSNAVDGHKVYSFYEHIPEHLEFKKTINSEISELKAKKKNRLYKAVRWSYKSFVIWYALKNIDADYIVWIDADVETISKVPNDLCSTICQDKLIMCYPQRIKGELHIETGFIIFNKTHKDIERVIKHYEKGYVDQQVLEISKPWDGFWLGILLKNTDISNLCETPRIPFTNIKRYFKHHLGKDKFQQTSLDKHLGRKKLT